MRTFVISLLILFSLNGVSQTVNTISCDNYASEVFKGVFVEMPDYRELKSGSKFIVSYEGDWKPEMVGAFEYAVKLWEEVLPTTLPIYIKAVIGPIRGSRTTLSKVSFDAFENNDDFAFVYSAPMSMIKGILLQEYDKGNTARFNDIITDMSMLQANDMTITYNSNLLNEMSFSLDGNPSAQLYDFVTMALRDIAIGLGFTTSFTASEGAMNFTGRRLTPYESLVMKAIGSNDPNTAYINATKGSLIIRLDENSYNPQIPELTMYAPSTWQNGVSLRYLVPSDNIPISRLLTYDFGKGYIIRDISGTDWSELFQNALEWRTPIVTGNTSNSIIGTGTTNDKLPFSGQVSLDVNISNINYVEQKNYSDTETIKKSSLNSTGNTIAEFCKPYHCFAPDNDTPTNLFAKLTLSVLKKDGSWDLIYRQPYYNTPQIITIEDYPLSFDEADYARGTTGGLRYRLCIGEAKYDPIYKKEYYSYRVKYFTRDYTPQKAYINYSGRLADIPIYSNSSNSLIDDEYFVDVKIGIANIEGTTKVVVEQLDEGESLPFLYEVKDFRKGYFIANLDRELTTQLTVVCYNENGYKRSNTITIPPMGYSSRQLLFDRISDDIIHISGLQKIDGISYSVQNLVRTDLKLNNKTLVSEDIDISNISNGVYILNVYEYGRTIGTYKFCK